MVPYCTVTGFYFTPRTSDQFREYMMGRARSTYGSDDKCYKNLITNPEGKIQFVKRRVRQNTENELRGGLDSSGSGQGPVAGCCEHGDEPSGSIQGRGFDGRLSKQESRGTELEKNVSTHTSARQRTAHLVQKLAVLMNSHVGKQNYRTTN
jgi:hypothetical protein